MFMKLYLIFIFIWACFSFFFVIIMFLKDVTQETTTVNIRNGPFSVAHIFTRFWHEIFNNCWVQPWISGGSIHAFRPRWKMIQVSIFFFFTNRGQLSQSSWFRYDMVIHTALQWQQKNIIKILNPQKTPHNSPVRASFCEHLGENWPCFNGTTRNVGHFHHMKICIW